MHHRQWRQQAPNPKRSPSSQTCRPLDHLHVVNSMTELEFSAWNSFVLGVTNFWGNLKAENHKELVENMLSNFRDIGANMSIKIHYCFLIWTALLQILETIVKSRVKDFTRILKPWKKDTRADGMTT